MLLKTASSDILAKLLANAVRSRDAVTGQESLFFKCTVHGEVTQRDLQFGLTRHLDCAECVAIGMLYRRALSLEHAEQPASLEPLEESISKACEEATKGTLDLVLFPRAIIHTEEETRKHLARRDIVLMPSRSE